MDRANFLKALAALGLTPSLNGVKGVEGEEESKGEWVEKVFTITDVRTDLRETFKADFPTTVKDWEKLGVNEEKLHELAQKYYSVMLQANARNALREERITPGQLQDYVDAYHYDPGKFNRRPRHTTITVDASKLNLTQTQIKYLENMGIRFKI